MKISLASKIYITNIENKYNSWKIELEQIQSQMIFKEERIEGMIRENTLLQEIIHEYEERVNIREKKNK